MKFNADGELPLTKIIKIPSMTVVVRAIFFENYKYYPQFFLDKYSYNL